MSQCDIIISYRQADASDCLVNLLSAFRKHFSYNRLVIGNEGPDAPETDADLSQLAPCVLITIIGPDWLTARDSIGHRRLDNPHDVVRQQIKSALLAGVRIIPVLVDGAEMPRAASLPPELKLFARRKAFRCEKDRWASDSNLVMSKTENAVWEAELKEERYLKKQKIADLAPLEALAWTNIHSKPDIETLNKFLDEFPDGAHSSEASSVRRIREKMSLKERYRYEIDARFDGCCAYVLRGSSIISGVSEDWRGGIRHVLCR